MSRPEDYAPPPRRRHVDPGGVFEPQPVAREAGPPTKLEGFGKGGTVIDADARLQYRRKPRGGSWSEWSAIAESEDTVEFRIVDARGGQPGLKPAPTVVRTSVKPPDVSL